MTLKNKAGLIDFSNIESNPTPVKSLGLKTSIGLHADAIFRDEKVSAENKQLKEQLEEFNGANPVRLLDPAKIHPSKWANRHSEAFNSSAFVAIKEDIAYRKENVQPIKVRKIKGTDEYEIVYGHRRHQACLQLGLPVKALIAELDDQTLFIEMDQENRHRQDLSAYEQGMMYKTALDAGLYPSLNALCFATGANQGNSSLALRLASLPDELIEAFPSKLDIPYKWIQTLLSLYSSESEALLLTAQSLTEKQKSGERLSSKDVYEALTYKGKLFSTKASSIELVVGGTVRAEIKKSKDKYAIEFKKKALTEDQIDKLESFLTALWTD